ncbi:hypothetical protein Zmor_006267 [Zophobas morio]|uniref:Uncharacterized protein n=1 Tax=Zophobas morio TaxID=2755281 RepID=A0AA38IRC3_9CUCU|nr:hypothetical protein Zmor_006267 [Zophobas morio]
MDGTVSHHWLKRSQRTDSQDPRKKKEETVHVSRLKLCLATEEVPDQLADIPVRVKETRNRRRMLNDILVLPPPVTQPPVCEPCKSPIIEPANPAKSIEIPETVVISNTPVVHDKPANSSIAVVVEVHEPPVERISGTKPRTNR